MTRVIAHRGYSAKYPEMSREAYVNAIPVSDGFECDLHLTSDLKLFCWHDDTMDRTSNMSGDVHEMTWETISKATPQPILFKEFMDIAMGAGKDVLIETKHPQKFKGLLEKRLKAELDQLNPKIDMSFMSLTLEQYGVCEIFQAERFSCLRRKFKFLNFLLML